MFREFVELDQELSPFLMRLKQGVKIEPGDGSVSVTFPKMNDVTAQPARPQAVAAPPTMQLAAHTRHPGRFVSEVTQKGWKGPTATGAIAGKIGHWTAPDKKAFEKAMDGGRKSLPSVVGREMGLLFEIEVFIYLLTAHGLKPVGSKDLTFATNEKTRLEQEIANKLSDAKLASTVCEFIRLHAGGGPDGMGEMIHKKATALIRVCVIDAVEFTGGDVQAYAAVQKKKLMSDTADIRLVCSSYSGQDRNNLGFSLKAVTETQIEVRSFSVGKAFTLLGGQNVAALKNVLGNPLYEDREKYDAVLDMIYNAARRGSGPRRFAKLLEFLVTGGADTLPAYRMLIRNAGGPGWSGAVQKDFTTSDAEGRKVAPQAGAKIDVKKTKTYVSLTYMVPGGNHFGTSVKFEPAQDLKSVSVYVSNLASKK